MTVLVTGASSGIGRCIALELARRGCDLILVSRSLPVLESFAAELSRDYGIRAVPIAADLSVPGAAESLYRECVSRGFEVDVLVNDAGFTVKTCDEWNCCPRVESMLEVLAVTPPALCARFGADMRRKGRGYILNVSSASAYFPVGIMRTYSAVKRFLLEYTVSLHYELEPSGVKVSCLAPGGVRSHFMDANSLKIPGGVQWIANLFLMSPERTARIAVRGLFRGKKVIVPGLLTKIYTGITFLVPKKWTYRFFNLIERVRSRLENKQAGSSGAEDK